jgi:hypothetical protein
MRHSPGCECKTHDTMRAVQREETLRRRAANEYGHRYKGKGHPRSTGSYRLALFLLQDGVCPWCESPLNPEGRGSERPEADHDHDKCGHPDRAPGYSLGCDYCIRALVHQRCNAEMGYLGKHPRASELLTARQLSVLSTYPFEGQDFVRYDQRKLSKAISDLESGKVSA